jgi:hypothetical protein
MKTSSSLMMFLSLALAAPDLTAAPRESRNYVQQTDTFDAAGGNAISGRYSQTTTVGGIGGEASSAGSTVVAKLGYTGQLSDATNLVLHASPVIVNEGETSRLSATATLDDGTVSQLDGRDLFWPTHSGPVASIDAQGLLTAAYVYQRSSARIEGRYPGRIAFIDIGVLNVGDDDFWFYVRDGLPDLWQVQCFGENNHRGVASGDADGDGQSNFAEFMAGTSPTNVVSRFHLELATLPNQPTQKYLFFSPRLNDRSYTVEYSLDLGEGFKPLTNTPQLDFGETRVVLDTDASEPRRFYRVKISR